MTTPQKYDAIIIGASTASVSYLIPTLARAGWRTALIEREHVGGTCVNVGWEAAKQDLPIDRAGATHHFTTGYGD